MTRKDSQQIGSAIVSAGPVPDLSVDLCGIPLKSPLILASGGLSESVSLIRRFLGAGAAAAVTRTTRLHVPPDREVFPSPHLFFDRRRGYLLNSEWGNIRPWTYWRDNGLTRLRKDGPVILSVSGRDPDDCVGLIRIFEEIEGVAAYEINVSCSHAGAIFGSLESDYLHTAKLLERLKTFSRRPLIPKISASPSVAEFARCLESAGADAIATTNSLGPGLDINLDDGSPVLGIESGAGGMSGRAIFPIALRAVAEVANSVAIPVIGIGGISSYKEVVKMLMVGAKCVQIYTEAFLRGPKVFEEIGRGLEKEFLTRGWLDLESPRGMSQSFLGLESNRVPVIPDAAAEKCTNCGACIPVCLPDAISLFPLKLDPEKCIGCGACVSACPPSIKALTY